MFLSPVAREPPLKLMICYYIIDWGNGMVLKISRSRTLAIFLQLKAFKALSFFDFRSLRPRYFPLLFDILLLHYFWCQPIGFQHFNITNFIIFQVNIAVFMFL